MPVSAACLKCLALGQVEAPRVTLITVWGLSHFCFPSSFSSSYICWSTSQDWKPHEHMWGTEMLAHLLIHYPYNDFLHTISKDLTQRYVQLLYKKKLKTRIPGFLRSFTIFLVILIPAAATASSGDCLVKCDNFFGKITNVDIQNDFQCRFYFSDILYDLWITAYIDVCPTETYIVEKMVK